MPPGPLSLASLAHQPPTPPSTALPGSYYEPLASVAPSIDHIVSGPRLRKLLFMASPQAVEARLKPHWAAALEGTSAETMQVWG